MERNRYTWSRAPFNNIKDYYIIVSTNEQSIDIQQQLFKLGYEWFKYLANGGGANILKIHRFPAAIHLYKSQKKLSYNNSILLVKKHHFCYAKKTAMMFSE